MSTTLSSLPSRGASLAANPARIDMDLFMEATHNLYDPKTNPDGAFPLNVAENGPMIPLIKEKLQSILHQNALPV